MNYGKPEDVEGQCNAWLEIGDDYGDNEATMRCQREAGHEGPHREVFRNGSATVEWTGNDREKA